MSDAAHLLIPFASCEDPGCAQARAALELPTLEKLLATLAPTVADEGSEHTLSMPHERALARLTGLPAEPDGRIPLAAAEALRAGLDGASGAWAFISPCHWEVGQDRVVMAPPAALGLSADESRALLAVFAPWFEQDGIALHYESPERWLARGEVFRDMATASLDRVSGRVIGDWMPRGEAGKAVRRLQQEMQMLLYTHAISEERANSGRAGVNSFWVSGTGALPASATLQAPAGLVVAHSLREAALAGDWSGWSAAWRSIDETQCRDLLAALGRGEQVALTLCGERNSRTFSGTQGGFMGKLRAALRGRQAPQVLASL